MLSLCLLKTMYFYKAEWKKCKLEKNNVEIYFSIFMNPFKFLASKNFEIPFRCTFHKTVVLQL